MNEQKRETISALVDGELPSHEISATVKHLIESDDLCGEWSRYHLIGDVLRGEIVNKEYQQIVAIVSSRLQGEPTILAPPPENGVPASRSWMKPAVGTALAASVAVMAVILTPQFINEKPAAAPRLAGNNNPPSTLYARQSGTRWDLRKPAVESKLNRYLINHQEYASSNSMKGILPYATFVSYDSGR